MSSGTTENNGLRWENSCLDTYHLLCGMADLKGEEQPVYQGWSFFLLKYRIPGIFVFCIWLSNHQNQENKVWQADECSEKTTAKCDKEATNLVACGSDNAIATMAWNQGAFPRLRAVNPKLAVTPLGWYLEQLRARRGQRGLQKDTASKSRGKDISYFLSYNCQFPKISGIKGLCSRGDWFWMSC